MKLYFAVTDSMLDAQVSSKEKKLGFFQWILSGEKGKYGESFLAGYLGISAGDVMNAMTEYNITKPYNILCGEILDKDLLEGLRAAMIGNVVWQRNIYVHEMSRIE